MEKLIRKNVKNNVKGITLIALVVTIIVLLILAGVAISMLTGDNSILKRAQSTQAYNVIGAAKDEVGLAYNEALASFLQQKYDAGQANPATFSDLFGAEIEKANTKMQKSNTNTGTISITYVNNIVTIIFTDLQALKTYTTTATLIDTTAGETLGAWTVIVPGDLGSNVGGNTGTNETGNSENTTGPVTPPAPVAVTAGGKATTTSKDNYTDSSSKKATIPAGFTVSGIASEQNIDNGLVIYLIPDGVTPDWTTKATGDAYNASATGDNIVYDIQTKYDQFVWIPVDQTNKPMYKVATAEGYASADANNPNYEGVLYSIYNKTANSGQMSTYGQSSTSKSQYREPDTVSDYDGTESYLSVISTITGDSTNYVSMAKFQETMQKDYNEMVKSVQEYGGFWIGRYESSLVSGKTRVIAGQTSMNASNQVSVSGSNQNYRWYGLYARQKQFATDSNLGTGIKSGMIWGSQYDAMLNWMVANNVKVISTPSGTSRNTSRVTGATKNGDATFNDKIKNIYDILGNSSEWTAEAYNTSNRAYRGGNYGNPSAPFDRSNHLSNNSYAIWSSRPYFIISGTES